MNDEIQKTLDLMDQIRREIKALEIRFAEKRVYLRSICEHKDYIKTTDYESGTYYDRAKYITNYTCNICGHVTRDIIAGGYG